MSLRDYQGTTPRLDTAVYVDETALVIGDVHIGTDSSVWPMSVVRGDVNRIAIGQRSNIQDGSILHVTHRSSQGADGFELVVGDEVTIGHKVVLHGCRIGNQCLIGMGAIVMDGVHIADRVLLGAGSLVPPGKALESGYLYLGNPARRVRALSEEELAYLGYSAQHYVALKNRYIGEQSA